MDGEFRRVRSGPTPPEQEPRPGDTGSRVIPGLPSARAQRKRLVLLLAGLTSVVTLLASGSAWAITGWVADQINRTDVFGALSEDERPDAGPRGALNVLVLGSDARATSEEPARADTMMLVHLNRDRDHVTVVGIPRDSWVTIPGYGPGKINAAYAHGGPSLAIDTVEQNTGVRVDHYVEIDFTGFVDVVDALGGIEVCLPEAISDDKAKLDLPAGTHRVDGEGALAFSRTRASSGGDLDRIDRQQQVLAALLDEALSSGTLADPARFTAFLDHALGAVTVDEGLDATTIRQLGNQVSSIDLDDVTFTQVPIGQMDFWTPNDDVAVVWERDGADELFDRLRKDEPLDVESSGDSGGGTDAAEAADQSPGDVTVQVYNGVGTPGLGSQVRAALMTAGFRSPSPAEDWSSRDVPETLVRHAPGQRDAAEAVADAIPGSRTEEAAELTGTVEVILGFNYERVDISAESAAPADTEETEPAEAEATPGRDSLTTSTARDNVCAS